MLFLYDMKHNILKIKELWKIILRNNLDKFQHTRKPLSAVFHYRKLTCMLIILLVPLSHNYEEENNSRAAESVGDSFFVFNQL